MKKVLAIVLALAMAAPFVSLSASAKSKKYVKSINVSKKVTMTLSDGRRMTKAVKVTVKVSGKASKKFTVKSSNSSVVEAKVSSGNVKLTAKKAGSAAITVKSKGKGKNGKAITKKISVTVRNKKSSSNNSGNNSSSKTPAQAVKTIKDYLDRNGRVADDGDRYIAWKYEKTDLFIAHPSDEDCVDFLMGYEFDDGSNAVASFKIYEGGEAAVSVVCGLNDYYGSTQLVGGVEMDKAGYTGSDLYFTISTNNGYSDDIAQGLCNSMLRLLMVSSDLALQDNNLPTLKDLGFVSYE